MPLQLVRTDPDQRFDLREGATLVVGRAVQCDVSLVDPTVSRRHAELVVQGDALLVRDLASSNGTFVNGVKVSEGRATVGDTLTFGKVAVAVAAGAAPPLPPPPAARPGATVVRQLPAGNSMRDLAAVLRSSGPHAAEATDEGPGRAGDAKLEQKLTLLLEVSKGLTRAADVDALLEKVASYVFQILEVDRTAVLLLDDRHQLVPKFSRDKKGGTVPRAVPQSIARMVVDEKVAVLSDDAGGDQRFGGQSILMQQVRSAMCAPLLGNEQKVLGVLYVDNSSLTRRFTDEDLDFLIAFSAIAAVALENSQFADRIRREALVRSNFERFFTPQLAARIANAADAVRLGGDKRMVAVLFSDIRGFTALSETMNPDDMARLLTEYFTEMVDCVFRHGGTLDKFIGDAVMAQWGAPIGEADDPDRALAAALDMMAELDKLNAQWRLDRRPELQIGIGLNYGEAFAGNIGSERRLEYTVIGDTVNTASRLCGVAGPGEILLSESMVRALHHPREFEAGAPLELKGKSQPVPVWRVKR